MIIRKRRNASFLRSFLQFFWGVSNIALVGGDPPLLPPGWGGKMPRTGYFKPRTQIQGAIRREALYSGVSPSPGRKSGGCSTRRNEPTGTQPKQPGTQGRPLASLLKKWFCGKFWVALALPVLCAPVSTRAKPVAHFLNGLLFSTGCCVGGSDCGVRDCGVQLAWAVWIAEFGVGGSKGYHLTILFTLSCQTLQK